MVISFTLLGAPRTKKNHGVIAMRGKPRLLPSLQYAAWDRLAQQQLARLRSRAFKFPISVPVNCRAIFFRDAARGDAVGYYQALADTLEKGGIVKNDSLITSWDGTRMLNDASNPRVEVTLEAI